MIYHLGDKVKIRVVAVHLEQKMVDFSLVESARKPRRVGKNGETKSKKKSLRNCHLKRQKNVKSAVKIKTF